LCLLKYIPIIAKAINPLFSSQTIIYG